MSGIKISGVITTYTVNGVPYGSYIIGDKLSKIKSLAAKRRLKETIESGLMEIVPMPLYLDLSDSEFIERLPEILHTATFLSFIAVKAKTMKAVDLLADDGLLHELTHLLADIQGCHSESLKCIRDLLRNLQKAAIGCYGDEVYLTA